MSAQHSEAIEAARAELRNSLALRKSITDLKASKVEDVLNRINQGILTVFPLLELFPSRSELCSQPESDRHRLAVPCSAGSPEVEMCNISNRPYPIIAGYGGKPRNTAFRVA